MSHIFISYSRRDIDFAQKIVDALAANNLDTWIDWKSIPKGEDWEQEIYRGIEEADAFLFLVSVDSVQSEMCNKEIAHALKNGKRILPIVLRDTDRKIIHPEINKRNWVFCRDGQDDFNKAIEEARKTIHTDYEWLKYHTKLQVKALDWERKKDTSFLLRGRELREAEQQIIDITGLKDPQATALQRQYILNSQRNEVRIRRQVTLVLLAGLVIMAVLSIIAWGQRNFAISSQEIAQAASTQAIKQRDKARAGELAALALSSLDDNLGLSLLLSVEAYNKSDTLQTRSALLRTLVTYPSIKQLMYGGWLGDFEFSPDSRVLAANTRTGEITLWEVNTGRIIRHISITPWGVAERLVFSADGKILAVGGCDTSICEKSGILVLNLATGDQQGLWFFKPEIPFPIFTVSSNGKFVFLSGCGKFDMSQCVQGQIAMFDATTGNVVEGPWLVHTGKPRQLSYDVDKNKLVSIGCSQNSNTGYCIQDEAVSIDPKTGEIIARKLPVNVGDNTNSWLISPEGSIAIRYYKNEVSIWSIAKEKEIESDSLSLDNSGDLGLSKRPRWNEASVSQNGKFVVIPEMQDLLILDHSIPLLLFSNSETILGTRYEIRAVKISPDGQKFAAERTGSGWLFSHQTFESFILGSVFRPTLSYKLDSDEGIASAWDPGISAFNPNGRSFATVVCRKLEQFVYKNYSCTQEAIALWDAKGFNLISILSEPGATDITSMTYSPDGNILATGDMRGQITFWDVTKRKLVHKVESSSGSLKIWSLAFSPDGKILAVGLEPGDGIVLDIWDVAHQVRIKSISAKDIQLKDNYIMEDVAFSPEGNLLAGAIPQENKIVIWNTSNWDVFARLETPTANGVSFNPDGKTLAAAGWDGSVTIWNLDSLKPVGRPVTVSWSGNLEGPSSLAFNKQGTELITGFQNFSIWDMSTRQIVGQPFGRSGSNIAMSPDGKKLVSGGYIWDLDPQSWANHACQIAGRNFTRAEWMQYFPDEEYRSTCSQWPLEPESTPTPLPSETPDVTPTVDQLTGKIININTASLEELEALPGITSSLAQVIIDFREQNGPFRNIEDIMYIPGIGPSTFEKIRDFITVGP